MRTSDDQPVVLYGRPKRKTSDLRSKIQQLDADVVAEALRFPAGLEDAQWDDDAIDVVVDASGRYPYFLQQFGQETWTVAAGPVIAKHDAALGVAHGTNDLGPTRASLIAKGLIYAPEHGIDGADRWPVSLLSPRLRRNRTQTARRGEADRTSSPA